MRPGPVEDDIPPPIGYGARSDLSKWLADIPPGKSRRIECEPHEIQALQVNIGARAYRMWGKAGHATRAVEGGVRVWRLTEDQRAALVARLRTRREQKE